VIHEVIDGNVPQRRRAQIVEAYQAGYYQTLLLHPQTGAHGLTLKRGTATIWASPIYQPDFLKQGMHRIFRGGQTEKTETILIEAKGTVEKLVYERLSEKSGRMQSFLDLLKERSAE
jgi:SNF2 family DNA or RNA helicase